MRMHDRHRLTARIDGLAQVAFDMASRGSGAALVWLRYPSSRRSRLDLSCATIARRLFHNWRTLAFMTATIGFRPTEEDEQIIKAAMRSGERKSDVIRRALRLLEREVWVKQARADAEQLHNEDLSDEQDAW